jgi:hypothetical protein
MAAAKAGKKSARAGPAPAIRVDPAAFTFAEVFSQNPLINSLNIDYALLTNKISHWIDIEVTRRGVVDRLSEFLLSSFTTLLTTYIPPIPVRGKILTGLTTTDVVTVINKLKDRIRPALEDLDVLRTTAKYTEFCSNFLGKMTGIEARAILEVLDPDPQCNALVEDKRFCWICGLGLRDSPKPECEHILPISDALLHLNLYQNRSSLEKLNKYEVTMLKLEYLWSHQCCNQSKNNLQYIMSDGANTYKVNPDGINKTIERIRAHADPDDPAYDCPDIFRNASDFKHLSSERIETYIQPIVDTINLHITYLAKANMLDRQKAFLVYEYLILIRFFSRIPGCTLVEAFKEHYLSDDATSRAAALAEEKRMKQEIARIKQEDEDEKKAIREKRDKEVEQRRIQKQQALIKKQEEASARQKNAISGGRTRAERYAEKMAQKDGSKDNKLFLDSVKFNSDIIGITTTDDVQISIAVTEIMDETLNEITGVTTGVTTVEGGNRRQVRRLRTANYKPNPIVYKTSKANSNARFYYLTEKRKFSERLAESEQNRIKTDVLDIFDQIGTKVDKIINSTEAKVGQKGTLFTNQDVDNLQLLYTIPVIQSMKQDNYNRNDRDIHRILNDQSVVDEKIGLKVLNEQLGGAYPNNETPVEIDPYAIIQNDFTTEKAFVFLSAYYPVYLRMNNLKHLTADQYMSTPHILRDTLTYFGADLAEYRTLLMNDSHGVSTLQPRVRVVPTQSPQNIAKLMTALSRRPQSQYHANIRHNSPYTSIMGRGGKRHTKKRRVVKRRTRKHKKN